MCIISVKLQIMIKHEGLLLDYKLSPAYHQKVNALVTDSKVSFQNFQTPGWTSIMHTETSPDLSASKQQTNHNKILQKLSRLKEVDLGQSNFSKIRVPNSTKSKDIFIYQESKHLIQDKRNKENYPQRRSLDSKDKNNQNRIQKSNPRNPLRDSTYTQKNSKSQISLKQVSTVEANLASTKTVKRFNQITVHQHLYLDGIKQSNKRVMQQILDQQYKKTNIMPFHPQINSKSQQLAQVKFSRLKQKSQMETQLEQQMKKSQMLVTKRQRGTVLELKQQNRYKVLRRLFSFLSKQGQTIRKDTIKEVIEQLPLMCIKTLSKVLQKIYIGKTLNWLQFIGQINDKKIVSNKEGLINIFQKWQTRLDQKQKQRQTKQNTTNG